MAQRNWYKPPKPLPTYEKELGKIKDPRFRGRKLNSLYRAESDDQQRQRLLLKHQGYTGHSMPMYRRLVEGVGRNEDGTLFEEAHRGKADARVGVNDEAALDGKTRKKLRKSEQLRAQRRSKRRLRVGGNLSIGTKGDSGAGTGGSKKSSLNIPKG